MSQTLRQIHCRGLILLKVSTRGHNTHLGAVSCNQKTHADLISQFQSRNRGAAPPEENTTVITRHGKQLVSIVPQKNRPSAVTTPAAPTSSALHTALTPPRSLAHVASRRRDDDAASKITATPSGDVRSQVCTTTPPRVNVGRFVTPYVDQNEVLKEKHQERYNFCKETLRALSVQELDKLFNIVNCSRGLLGAGITPEAETAESRGLAPPPPPYTPHYNETLSEMVDLLTQQSQKFSAILKHVDLQLLRKSAASALPAGFWHENAECYGPPEPQTEAQVLRTLNNAVANANKHRRKPLPLRQSLLTCVSTNPESLKPTDDTPPPAPPPDNNRPNLDQLNTVKESFTEWIPVIIKKHSYHLYTEDVMLENNYVDKPYVKTGLRDLVFQVAHLRWKVCMRYMTFGFSVEGATVNEPEGSVCLHVRLAGIRFLWRRVLKLWKWMPWSYDNTAREYQEQHEGLVTLHVNKEGKVYKIRIDKIVVDPFGAVEKDPSLVEKITLGAT